MAAISHVVPSPVEHYPYSANVTHVHSGMEIANFFSVDHDRQTHGRTTGQYMTTILLAEDEGIVAEDLRKQLTRLGYTVCAVVATGEDAVQRAEQEGPDLLLMDIRLNGKMDGVEAVARIHRRRQIPVIYMTAFGDAETLKRAKEVSCFGYLSKPLDLKDLHQAIEAMLGRT